MLLLIRYSFSVTLLTKRTNKPNLNHDIHNLLFRLVIFLLDYVVKYYYYYITVIVEKKHIIEGPIPISISPNSLTKQQEKMFKLTLQSTKISCIFTILKVMYYKPKTYRIFSLFSINLL